MVQKLDEKKISLNERHYERELDRPQYGVTGKLKALEGKEVLSLNSAAFYDSVKHFLSIYKTCLEEVSEKSLPRATGNIYASYAGAVSSLEKIKPFSTNGAKFSGYVNFDSGFHTFSGSLVENITHALDHIGRPEELPNLAASYFNWVIDACREAYKNPILKAELVDTLTLQVNSVTIKGLSYSKQPSLNFTVTLDDIVGNQEAIKSLRSSIHGVLMYDPNNKENVLVTEFDGYSRTILLHSEPGNGKSVTIEAVLNDAQLTAEEHGKQLSIFNLTNALKSKYYSESANNFREKFDEAKKGDASYIFIADDSDTTFFSREELRDRPEDKAILGTFMNYLEGLEASPYGNDLIILATNYIEAFDKALLSRMEKVVYVPGPQTVEEYKQLFGIKLKNSRKQGLVSLNEKELDLIGREFRDKGYSGRDVKNIAKGLMSQIYDSEIDKGISLKRDDKIKFLRSKFKKITYEDVKEVIGEYENGKKRKV